MPKTTVANPKQSKQATKPKAQQTKKNTQKPGKVAQKPKVVITKKAKKQPLAKRDNPLYEARPRNFGIAQLQPKRDLTRFVKWPKYVRVQRQKRILLQRLKVPGTINQFSHTLDKNAATVLFTLLNKYKPETKKDKKRRLLAEAKKIAAAKKVAHDKLKEERKKNPDAKLDLSSVPKPTVSKRNKRVKYGLQKVTKMVEQKKAKLVIIAHDVDPLELVMWLPTLCKKKDVPYLIVKGKAALGRVVNKKTAAVVAIDSVKKRHHKDLENLIQRARDNFNNRYSDIVKRTGGQIMGSKHIAKKAKFERIKASEGKK